MSLEVFYNYRKSEDNSIIDMCKCHLFYHVYITLADGSVVDGIIREVNDDNIEILVAEDMEDANDSMNRQPPRRNRYRRYRPRRYRPNAIYNVGLVPYPIYPPVLFYPPFFPIY